MKTQIKIETIVKNKIDQTWEKYTIPKHIVKWNAADESWHTTNADNDFREDGKFSYRMEAKDKSAGFDFSGTYTKIQKEKEIAYTLDDERKVDVRFLAEGDKTVVTVKFEAEEVNSVEMQRKGWQSILNNFKAYCEENTI